MNIKNRKDIIYGEFELDSDEFLPKNVKTRITTFVDEDALEKLKKIADLQGIKYQTLLNQVIRSFVSGANTARKSNSRSLTEAGVRRIVREELKKRA